MMKILSIALLLLFFAACQNTEKSNNSEENNAENAGTSLQNAVPEVSLSEFEKSAADYVGKEIKVKGIVDHVCKHGGKKLLLVSDDADLHVESDTRFDESLAGSEVVVHGIVQEFVVDEAYCLKMDEDNIKSHNEGKSDDKSFEQKKKQIAFYRDSMEKAGVDHLSFYSLKFVSLDEPDK